MAALAALLVRTFLLFGICGREGAPVLEDSRLCAVFRLVTFSNVLRNVHREVHFFLGITYVYGKKHCCIYVHSKTQRCQIIIHPKGV